MNHRLALLFLFPVLLIPACSAPPEWPGEAGASLVAAERAFARSAGTDGMRAAFLAALADDAVIFRPGPVDGRAWFTAQPETEALLQWRPVFADVARSGDLGYTTGPWTIRPDRTPRPPAGHGHYVSLWQREPDGIWRVALDTGISHAAPPTLADTVLFPAAPSRHDLRLTGRTALLAADRVLRSTADLLAAFHPDARVYRMGALPVTDSSAARTLLAPQADTLFWAPEGAGLSSAGDLGYTYGLLHAGAPTAPAGNAYLHIWKQGEEGWQIVLDIVTPL